MGIMYKVIKDIPFLSKNQIVESNEGFLVAYDGGRPIHSYPLYALINHGWLEEIQEEKKETLADKFYKENQGYRVTSISAITLERIAKEHFQSHPEELGLVRIEDVLKVFTDAWFGWRNDPNSSTTLFVYIKEAIEGMKGEGK